jgi:hypothetical protein
VTYLGPITAAGVTTVATEIRCPLCGETIPIQVYFLSPGPDTNGLWDSEIDHGYLSQHMHAEHGAAR